MYSQASGLSWMTVPPGKVFQPSRHFCSPSILTPQYLAILRTRKHPLLCRSIRPSMVGSDAPWANTTPSHPKPRCWETGAWAHVPLAKAPNFPLLWPRVPWTSLSPALASKKVGGLKEGEISWRVDKKNRAYESLSHQMSDFRSQELILNDQIVTHVYRKATDSGRHKILTSILLMV